MLYTAYLYYQFYLFSDPQVIPYPQNYTKRMKDTGRPGTMAGWILEVPCMLCGSVMAAHFYLFECVP